MPRDRISHYSIIGKLGEGGMGVVYKAEDTKLGRTVALKFLFPGAIGADSEKARFIHEAQAAASLNHPNICTIHEIDESEGQSFIAMEYVVGSSLKARIESGPLGLDEAVDILLQTAEGLQEAHEKKIVHRDIKPANVMITPMGRVKVMDFGLARSADQTQLTKENTTLGTVAYMSPEQSRGEKVDHRTDIWSLGVMLYEMVTGLQPFRGEYEQAAIYSILNSEPEPPTALRTGVPMEIERIIGKCLAKDPGERYQTAADLIADLRRVRKSLIEKISTLGDSSIRRSSGKRYAWIGWVLALIVLALVITKILPRLIPPSREVTEQAALDERTRIVVLPFENLGRPDDDYFSDGITEEITSRLAAIGDLGVISRKSALHYKESDKTIEIIGKELNVDYILEGTVRWEGGGNGGSRVRVTPQLIRVSDDSHIWADSYDEDFEAIFDIQTRIAEQVASQLDITLTGSERDLVNSKPTENIIAYQLYLRGIDLIIFGHRPEENYRQAQRLFEQAIEIDPGFALAWAKLSHAHRGLYFFGYERTEERLAMAKEAIDRAIEIAPDIPEVRRELGFYYYQGLLDYDRALEEFSIVARSLPNDVRLLEDIAYIWRRQGHMQQAAGNMESAFRISPKDPGLCVELANTYAGLRRFEEAVEFSDRAIAMAPGNHWGYILKAVCLLSWNGDVERAKATMKLCPNKTANTVLWLHYYLEKLDRDYESALDNLQNVSGDVIRMQSAYAPVSLLEGLIYQLQGEQDLAMASYEAALEILERDILDNPEDPRLHSALGLTYAGLGRKDEAISSGLRAVELYPRARDAMLSVNRMRDLAQIYAMTGEPEAAIRTIREFLSSPTPYTIEGIRLDPSFDPIRDDPGYQGLLSDFVVNVE